jgi:hypothetical protein
VATAWDHGGGLRALVHPDGWVPLVALLVVGGLGFALTQISFQVGALAASFPANESAAPVVAVVLGAVLLGEHLPHSAPAIAAYLGCTALVVAGTIRLAGAHADPG